MCFEFVGGATGTIRGVLRSFGVVGDAAGTDPLSCQGIIDSPNTAAIIRIMCSYYVSAIYIPLCHSLKVVDDGFIIGRFMDVMNKLV